MTSHQMPRAQRYPKPGGYVLIARCVFSDDELLNDNKPFTRRLAWLFLIAHASYKPRVISWGSVHVTLQRGDILASLRTLGKQWHWTPNRVNRFLDLLVHAGRLVEHPATDAGTVYRVVNYDAYQAPQESNGTGSGTPVETATVQRRYNKNTSKEGNTPITLFSAADASGTESIWLTPFCDAWSQVVKGKMPAGKSVTAIAEVITANGETKDNCPETARRFRAYLTRNAHFSPSAQKFLTSHGQYAGGVIPISTGKAVQKVSSDEAKLIELAYGNGGTL